MKSEKLQLKNQNWRKVKLGEVADVKTGSTDAKDAVKHGSYPLFDRSMEIKRSDKYLFDDTAIILPGEGRDFVPRFYSGKFDLHQRAYAIFPHQKEVDPRYLYYAILKERGIFSQWAVGSTVKSLRMPIIKSVPVALPSLEIQKRIAEILSAFDEKIEVNNKISRTLEQMAQAIFKEWFVNFRFPSYEKTKFVDSELGKIPEGCKFINAESAFIFERGVESGSRYYSKNKKPGYIPFFRVKDLLSIMAELYIPEKVSKNKICDEKDVLLSLDASIGRVQIGCNGSYSSGIRKIYPKKDFNFIDSSFIYLWAKSYYVQNVLNGYLNSGSTIAHAGKATENFILPMNREIILEFQKVAQPIFSKILKIKKENQKLAALRDLLLPKLMSGEIRV